MIFHHIGIFVKSLKQGKNFLSKVVDIKHQSDEIKDHAMGVKVQFIYDQSDICYEIVAPLGKKNPVDEVLKSNKLLGEVVNVGVDSEISIKKLIKEISKILNVKLIPVVDKKRVRPQKSEVFRLKCNNKKIKRITNWKPIYKLDKGLMKLIEWMKEDNNLENYKPENYNI